MEKAKLHHSGIRFHSFRDDKCALQAIGALETEAEKAVWQEREMHTEARIPCRD
jgi:hypothetical protein